MSVFIVITTYFYKLGYLQVIKINQNTWEVNFQVTFYEQKI